MRVCKYKTDDNESKHHPPNRSKRKINKHFIQVCIDYMVSTDPHWAALGDIVISFAKEEKREIEKLNKKAKQKKEPIKK